MQRKILYIGGFKLPDRNAAAQRVIGIAKACRSLGHEVIFINRVQEKTDINIKVRKYYDFPCYDVYKMSELKYRITDNFVRKIIEKESINTIIAYNYPSVALARLAHYCKRNNIEIYADATEWEEASGSFLYRAIKEIDTKLRMEYIHPKMDGIIAISKYLHDYYCKKTRTILLPPLVDIADKKWEKHTFGDIKEEKRNKHNRLKCFVYAGSPGTVKERLDKIVLAFHEKYNNCPLELRLIGITEDEFIKVYKWKEAIVPRVTFLGRITHQQTLQEVMNADWTIIIRDNTRKNNAGFPTKFVESISCGTPVIANVFSNITDYLIDGVNGYVVEDSIDEVVKKAISMSDDDYMKMRNQVNRYMFDYKEYANKIKKLLG